MWLEVVIAPLPSGTFVQYRDCEQDGVGGCGLSTQGRHPLTSLFSPNDRRITAT